MKKFILFFFLFFIVALLSIATFLFFKPQYLVNTKNLKYVLEKTHVLKKWSWKSGDLDWGYKKWDNRTFKGHFEDFCFHYQSETIDLDTCLDEVSWDVENQKLQVKTLKPFVLHSSLTKVKLTDNKPKEKTAPADIWKYWQMLWSTLTPDMDLLFKEIRLTTGGKQQIFDFKLNKKPKELTAVAKGIRIWANPQGIEVFAPPKIPFPKKVVGMKPLFLKDFKLVAKIKETGIPLELTGSLATAIIKVNSYVDLPIKDDFASISFRKKVILATKANIRIPGIKRSLADHAIDPFGELPAPLNVMDGLINIDITTKNMPDAKMAMVFGNVLIDLASPKQVLKFDVSSETPLNLETFKPESVLVGLDFHQVQLQLPRMSKKSPPPQFIPDKRFRKAPYKKAEANTGEPLDVSIHLQALNEKAMSFRTNLIDEIIKLNFDLWIVQGTLQEGFLSVLPLKTSVFKRPIKLTQFKVIFQSPIEPVLEAQIIFPLPEYKITLNLEGPLSKPRYSFKSDPPLPQNDIYAVLLFGRPLSDLDPDDKTAAKKTNQLLSQGILSLSVLYFFAGSPVEYVGYDPGSKNATAQFGLGSKTSLRVGGGQEGLNSSAIRRSLGKGWYLDTSVQNSSDLSSSDTRNYGVLLERIITY